MDLINYTLRSLSYIVVEPSLLIMLFILGILFYFKNKKISLMQKMIIGEALTSPLELTLSQIVLGILSGILVSVFFSVLGVTFTETSGIQYIFLISILLMFVKPRFVCFSYSGAILGVISLIAGVITKLINSDISIFDIDIMSLMTFVGVMHIIESLLVMFDGDSGSIPVFTKKNNNIIGGYALSRYWIMPVAIFIAIKIGADSDVVSESIATPNWWPLLDSEYIKTILSTCLLTSMPFFGVIGYSSATFTRRKKEKKIVSGLYILGFGIILTAVAQLARYGFIGEVFAIVFAPVAHEFMLYIQKRNEEKRTPIFSSDDNGISILEVVPYSEMYNLGVRSGDKIISLNGNEVKSEKEIYEAAKNNSIRLKFKVLSTNGEIKDIELKEKNTKGIRVLLVPRVVDSDKIVPLEEKKFSDILKSANDKNKAK